MPTVTIRPTGEVVHLDPQETLLGGLYQAGYAYTIGCRRGGCGICKADLLEGQVSYNRPIAATVLTEDERAAGTCLTCRAVPEGDVTIALRDEKLRLINPLLRSINEGARHRAEAVRCDREGVS